MFLPGNTKFADGHAFEAMLVDDDLAGLWWRWLFVFWTIMMWVPFCAIEWGRCWWGSAVIVEWRRCWGQGIRISSPIAWSKWPELLFVVIVVLIEFRSD